MRITQEIEFELDTYQLEEIIEEAISDDADKVHDKLDQDEMITYLIDADKDSVVRRVVDECQEEIEDRGFIKNEPEEVSQYIADLMGMQGHHPESPVTKDQNKYIELFKNLGYRKEDNYLPIDDIFEQINSVMDGESNSDKTALANEMKALTRYTAEGIPAKELLKEVDSILDGSNEFEKVEIMDHLENRFQDLIENKAIELITKKLLGQ